MILVEWENCPKSVQNRQKRGLFIKNGNIDSKYDSIIHFRVKFNSKEYSINFFRNIQFKNYSIIFFPGKFNSKLIQKFKFGLIQFNKIFIQLENQGIEHYYLHRNICAFSHFSVALLYLAGPYPPAGWYTQN